MWHANLGIISIAEQTGGPDDGGIGDLKVDLWRLLKQNCTTTFCQSVDHFAIMLYVGGELRSFGPDTFRNLRRSKKHRDISVEVVISIDTWQTKSATELRKMLSDIVLKALMLCVKRIKTDGDIIDENSLTKAVSIVLNDFNHGKVTEAPGFRD